MLMAIRGLGGTEALIGPMMLWEDALAGVLDEMQQTETTGDSNG